jgi:hypothetical protein
MFSSPLSSIHRSSFSLFFRFTIFSLSILIYLFWIFDPPTFLLNTLSTSTSESSPPDNISSISSKKSCGDSSQLSILSQHRLHVIHLAHLIIAYLSLFEGPQICEDILLIFTFFFVLKYFFFQHFSIWQQPVSLV